MYWLFFVFSASHPNQVCNIAGFIKTDNVAMFPFSYQNSAIRKQKAVEVLSERPLTYVQLPVIIFQIRSRQGTLQLLFIIRYSIFINPLHAERWERRSLQGIRVVGDCTCVNGRAELAPTLSSEFFQLLSALFKHPFFTFFPYEPFVPLSMSRCIRKMLLRRIFTYRLKII